MLAFFIGVVCMGTGNGGSNGGNGGGSGAVPVVNSPGTALVAEYPFEHKGETFRLTRPTLQSELEYTRFLEAKTIQKLQVHAGTYGAAMHAKVLAENNLLLAAGAFEWGSARWVDSLDVAGNAQELSFLCAKQNYPGLTRPRWEDVFKAHWTSREDGTRTNAIWQALWDLIASPNSNSPAATAPAPGTNP